MVGKKGDIFPKAENWNQKIPESVNSKNKIVSRKFETILFNINELKAFCVLRHINLNLLSQNDFCHF